ncbi:MAG: hypothetical protein HYZ85_01170, partial [Candidatus Omnitrophica bacterium]|nr:hypothetical protein [Candidatus Omnitrophota bacterium]
YSYEFVTLQGPGLSSSPGTSRFSGFPEGTEITVVFDPDTDITERYIENILISRTQADGVTHGFEYSASGELIRTTISYKGRTRAAFDHSVSAAGNKTIITEAGVTEEYNADGKIIFHTTPEGYKYQHTFERAKKAVTTISTETVTLPDGSTFTVDVPQVSLQDDPNGEEVHRVTLISHKDTSAQVTSEFENGVLTELILPDGNKLAFDRVETKENFNEETGETTVEIILLDARVIHSDGTVTEYREGKPFSITSATGRVISIALDVILSASEGSLDSSSPLAPQNDVDLVNPAESAQFHYSEALKLWNELVNPKWSEFQTPGTLPVVMEYSLEGKLASREFAEGVIELYGADGRIDQVMAKDGELLIQYTYDAEGNPTKIEMGAARRRLEASILKMRAEVAMQREEALARVAEREQVIDQTVEGQYLVARDKLLALREQIEAQRAVLATIPAKGPAKKIVGAAQAQIQVGLNQVNAALEDLAQQRADALKQLHEQVSEVSTQIETETQNAYTQIAEEEKKARDQILRQEMSPIIYHWYRKILGRDPSKAEYDSWIATADYSAAVPAGDVTGDF